MKLKLLVCVLAVGVSAAACKKGQAAQAAAAQATPPAAASTPQPAQAAAPAPPKPVPAQLPDVVARVNGEAVKKADFDRMIKTIEARAGQPIPPERRDEILRGALDQLVVYKLLAQEGKARGINITDADVDAKVGELKKQFPTEDAFTKALQQRGMTLDGLRSDARTDLCVSKLMDGEVATTPGPSDAEAQAFYAKNPDKFKQEEQVRASHILIRVDDKADAATRKKAKDEIESVLKQARAGADFAKLAQEHSQDGSAAQGGDLNYFTKEQMVPAFANVAFALKPGQISDVVTTQFGYHIIKVTDHKPGRVVPYEEASAKIKEYLGEQKKQQHAEAFIDGLKKKAKIEVLI
ncbi:MAG TPA: peptidylprolyl isomerase [Vicinamibacterales bacterium]|nr:peptidylprolyl isomerase [Vicinamibacterales bacterium]